MTTIPTGRLLAAAATLLPLLLGAPTARAAPDLLVNGGFESPGCGGNCILDTPGEAGFITGWTTFLSGVEYYSAGGQAAEGTMVVDLANYVYSSGGLRQTFATTAGAQYLLSFYAGNTASSGRTGTGWVRVQVGDVDQTVDTATATTAAYAWRRIDLPFTATGASTTLSFSNTQDSFTHFALIDGASVVATVPEPQALWLFGAGAALLGLALRRRRG